MWKEHWVVEEQREELEIGFETFEIKLHFNFFLFCDVFRDWCEKNFTCIIGVVKWCQCNFFRNRHGDIFLGDLPCSWHLGKNESRLPHGSEKLPWDRFIRHRVAVVSMICPWAQHLGRQSLVETVETAAMVSLTNTRRRGQQVNLSSMSMIYRRLEEEGAK